VGGGRSEGGGCLRPSRAWVLGVLLPEARSARIPVAVWRRSTQETSAGQGSRGVGGISVAPLSSPPGRL